MKVIKKMKKCLRFSKTINENDNIIRQFTEITSLMNTVLQKN